jgi:hypothetical protein
MSPNILSKELFLFYYLDQSIQLPYCVVCTKILITLWSIRWHSSNLSAVTKTAPSRMPGIRAFQKQKT